MEGRKRYWRESKEGKGTRGKWWSEMHGGEKREKALEKGGKRKALKEEVERNNNGRKRERLIGEEKRVERNKEL